MRGAVMDGYDMLVKIGEGSFGEVYRARQKSTGRIVALKKTRLHDDNDGIHPTHLREVSILRWPSHCEVVGYDGREDRGRDVFEYKDTDMEKFICSYKQAALMYQLCLGLAFVHSRGVLHRDLKPNILLMDPKTMLLKIADFGLARTYTPSINRAYSPDVIFTWYRAPELLLGLHYSIAADIWSVGCIFAELVNKKVFFHGDSELQQIHEIFSVLGTPNEQEWPGVTKLVNWNQLPKWRTRALSAVVPDLDAHGQDLLQEFLHYNPSKRISAKKALEHPYFDGVRQENSE
ncbi:hypothetical protein Tsubulata_007618 [Turnera subulata]|uniref:Protein kinase domain-containing protein n=1 Tax=Turnera subulata TaxID=218843 RepID=A0A9Q0G1P2_9ROSI|nr:hypothetical protein Tsubulata_007618 [Turnera subulata]